MKKLNIQFHTILSALVFSGLYAVAAYFMISYIPGGAVYQVIASALLFILYVNTLRLFMYEILGIRRTRASEMMVYFFMYSLTGVAVILPFLVNPEYVYESSAVRYVMIVFASIMLLKYVLYMVLGPLQDVVREVVHETKYSHLEYVPKVSVIVPAWNEEVGILGTIGSLLKSDYRNMEIVVINDGSTDGSDKLIRSFLKKRPEDSRDIKIKYEYKENGGKGSALNRAIELSSGEIIVSIDADCIVESRAIGELVEEFKNPKVMAAVGNVKIGNRTSTVGVIQHLEYLFSFYFKRAESLMGAIYIIGGAAGAFRKEVFEKLGKYSETNITEDIELTVRIQDAGMKVAYVPKALVYTEGASDMESLKKQRLRWKRGRFQTFYQYRHMFFSMREHHNKLLTLFVMPVALLQEVQLLLEIPFLIFLYSFSVVNNDYLSFVVGVLVVGMMFVVQVLFFEKSTRNLGFIALAPIGWLLFYVATYVEAHALLKSIWLFATGRELSWQSWSREGISGMPQMEASPAYK